MASTQAAHVSTPPSSVIPRSAVPRPQVKYLLLMPLPTPRYYIEMAFPVLNFLLLVNNFIAALLLDLSNPLSKRSRIYEFEEKNRINYKLTGQVISAFTTSPTATINLPATLCNINSSSVNSFNYSIFWRQQHDSGKYIDLNLNMKIWMTIF